MKGKAFQYSLQACFVTFPRFHYTICVICVYLRVPFDVTPEHAYVFRHTSDPISKKEKKEETTCIADIFRMAILCSYAAPKAFLSSCPTTPPVTRQRMAS